MSLNGVAPWIWIQVVAGTCRVPIINTGAICWYVTCSHSGKPTMFVSNSEMWLTFQLFFLSPQLSETARSIFEYISPPLKRTIRKTDRRLYILIQYTPTKIHSNSALDAAETVTYRLPACTGLISGSSGAPCWYSEKQENYLRWMETIQICQLSHLQQ